MRGNLHVEEDDSEIIGENLPQGGLAGIGSDNVEPRCAQQLLDRDEVARIVVDDEDFGGDGLARMRRAMPPPARIRFRGPRVLGHGACPPPETPNAAGPRSRTT